MEDKIAIPSGNAKPLFSILSIGIASFIGGILAACYMLGRNFENQSRTGTEKFAISALIGIGILGSYWRWTLPWDFISLLVLSDIPNVIISVIAARYLQRKRIQEHRASGGKLYSTMWAFVIGFIARHALISITYSAGRVAERMQ